MRKRSHLFSVQIIISKYKMASPSGVEVENLIPSLCSTLGVCPHWDEKTGKLIMADIRANSVLRVDIDTRQVEKIVLGEN